MNDQQRFENALRQTAQSPESSGGIGTLSEKTLHRVLKYYVSPYADEHEIKIGPYIADIVGEDGLIEVQTGGFDKLRKKLNAFLTETAVTLVYPIASEKRLIWIDPESGELSKPRKSPRKGKLCDAFFELYKIKQLLTHPNLQLRILLIDLDEYRSLGPKGSRKYGVVRMERIPLALVSDLRVSSAADYQCFLPASLPEQFTSRDLKEHASIGLPAASRALNVLLYVSAVVRCGKDGRYFVYERARF